MRAKRTEWRMRGIEPNKNVTSFSPHPSCLHDASAIHLPARSIATSPLWLKAVTCGLFLRCFTPPRRAPRGEGLIGCVVILSVSNAVVAISRIDQTNTLSFRASVEKSHTIETARCIYAPAYPPAVAHRREIPYNRDGNNRTRVIIITTVGRRKDRFPFREIATSLRSSQ